MAGEARITQQYVEVAYGDGNPDVWVTQQYVEVAGRPEYNSLLVTQQYAEVGLRTPIPINTLGVEQVGVNAKFWAYLPAADLTSKTLIDVYFQWKAVDAVGWETSSVRSLALAGLYHFDVTGLVSNTVYQYRAVTEVESDVIGYGDTLSFTAKLVHSDELRHGITSELLPITLPTTGHILDYFHDDFGGQAIDAAPSGWTNRRISANNTWSIKDSIGDDGDRVLRCASGLTTGYLTLMSWDGYDGADIDIVCRCKASHRWWGNTSYYPHHGFLVRGAISGSNVVGYSAAFWCNNADANKTFRISRVNGTASTDFYTLATMAYAWLTADYEWIRFQVIGTALKAKAWAGLRSDEPAAWMLETTDATYSTGWTTIFTYVSLSTSTNNYDFDRVELYERNPSGSLIKPYALAGSFPYVLIDWTADTPVDTAITMYAQLTGETAIVDEVVGTGNGIDVRFSLAHWPVGTVTIDAIPGERDRWTTTSVPYSSSPTVIIQRIIARKTTTIYGVDLYVRAGDHTVSFRDANNVELATCTLNGLTASTWNYFELSVPVAVVEETMYLIYITRPASSFFVTAGFKYVGDLWECYNISYSVYTIVGTIAIGLVGSITVEQDLSDQRILNFSTAIPDTVNIVADYTGVDAPVELDWELQTKAQTLTTPAFGTNVDNKHLWIKKVLSTTDLTVTPNLTLFTLSISESLAVFLVADISGASSTSVARLNREMRFLADILGVSLTTDVLLSLGYIRHFLADIVGESQIDSVRFTVFRELLADIVGSSQAADVLIRMAFLSLLNRTVSQLVTERSLTVSTADLVAACLPVPQSLDSATPVFSSDLLKKALDTVSNTGLRSLSRTGIKTIE